MLKRGPCPAQEYLSPPRLAPQGGAGDRDPVTTLQYRVGSAGLRCYDRTVGSGTGRVVVFAADRSFTPCGCTATW